MTAARLLEDNAGALAMDERLREALLRAEPGRDVEARALPGGRPSLRYRGEELYDDVETDPMARIAAQVASVELRPVPDAVVFFGFGLGIHAELIRRRCDAPIVVFEPRVELLRAALAARPLALPGVCVASTSAALVAAIDRAIDATDRRIVVAVLPGYRRAFPAQLARFRADVERALLNIEIRDATLGRAGAWIEHDAVNVPRLARRPNAAALAGAFRGVPGIFVGAGPSLDESLGALGAVGGRALVAGANAALRPLLGAGVVPEVAAIVEAADLRRHFDGLASLDRVVLATCSSTFPGHLDAPFADALNVVAAHAPEADWYRAAYGHEPFPSGGSVACAMFALLHRLGCDPIIAVGMDLAFSDSRIHATGSDPERASVRLDAGTGRLVPAGGGLEYRAETVPAIGGDGEVITNDVLSAYRTWLEDAAATWGGDRRLINATAKGARIEGFEEMGLAEALDRFGVPPSDLSARLREAIAALPPLDPEPLARAIEAEVAALKVAAAIAGEALDAADGALVRIRDGALEAADAEMERLRGREIALRAAARGSRLLNLALCAAVREIRDGRAADADLDVVVQTARSLERSRRLFAAIAKAAGGHAARFEGVAAAVRRRT